MATARTIPTVELGQHRYERAVATKLWPVEIRLRTASTPPPYTLKTPQHPSVPFTKSPTGDYRALITAPEGGLKYEIHSKQNLVSTGFLDVRQPVVPMSSTRFASKLNERRSSGAMQVDDGIKFIYEEDPYFARDVYVTDVNGGKICKLERERSGGFSGVAKISGVVEYRFAVVPRENLRLEAAPFTRLGWDDAHWRPDWIVTWPLRFEAKDLKAEPDVNSKADSAAVKGSAEAVATKDAAAKGATDALGSKVVPDTVKGAAVTDTAVLGTMKSDSPKGTIDVGAVKGAGIKAATDVGAGIKGATDVGAVKGAGIKVATDVSDVKDSASKDAVDVVAGKGVTSKDVISNTVKSGTDAARKGASNAKDTFDKTEADIAKGVKSDAIGDALKGAGVSVTDSVLSKSGKDGEIKSDTSGNKAKIDSVEKDSAAKSSIKTDLTDAGAASSSTATKTLGGAEKTDSGKEIERSRSGVGTENMGEGEGTCTEECCGAETGNWRVWLIALGAMACGLLLARWGKEDVMDDIVEEMVEEMDQGIEAVGPGYDVLSHGQGRSM